MIRGWGANPPRRPCLTRRIWPLLLIYSTMLSVAMSLLVRPRYPLTLSRTRLGSSSSSLAHARRIAVVGGGLAGLSTTYHLLQKLRDSQITVIDPHPIGCGGASAVAGGLLHPLSPRGKLVHLGMEGLAATNRLLDRCRKIDPNIALRSELYRVALNDKQQQDLQRTADLLPDHATWMTDLPTTSGISAPRGTLRLSGGCQVLNVPAYLRSLWTVCRNDADEHGNSVEWVQQPVDVRALGSGSYDAVVMAGGSSLFQSALLPVDDFPVQLVRGQSIELQLPEPVPDFPALLAGKYLSPTADPSRLLVGASHEFQREKLSRDQVVDDLKTRTENFFGLSEPYDVDRLTMGTRVQSERGARGRLPLIGLLPPGIIATNADVPTWIFTGLSSRGLLYHGLFGDLLTDAMVANDESSLRDHESEPLWWKKKLNQK